MQQPELQLGGRRDTRDHHAGRAQAAAKDHLSSGVLRRLRDPGPTDSRGEAYAPATSLPPLVLTVEADRYPAGAPPSTRMERWIVVGRSPVTIGRGPDMDLPIWDRSVSRRHAQMDWRDGAWVIRDMESTNGTRINGARLGASQVTCLQSGDRIEIGHDARLTVRSLLPILDPAGIARDLGRLLAWAADPARARGRDEGRGEHLQARLVGLREETVRLRDQLSLIARRGADADALPQVYERLTNMLDMLEHAT